MIEAYIAIAVVGALLVATITVGVTKIRTLEKNLTNLAQCFLSYVSNPDSINIIEDYPINSKKSKKSDSKSNNITFPNSEGF